MTTNLPTFFNFVQSARQEETLKPQKKPAKTQEMVVKIQKEFAL